MEDPILRPSSALPSVLGHAVNANQSWPIHCSHRRINISLQRWLRILLAGLFVCSSAFVSSPIRIILVFVLNPTLNLSVEPDNEGEGEVLLENKTSHYAKRIGPSTRTSG